MTDGGSFTPRIAHGLLPPPSSILDTIPDHTVDFLSKLLTDFWAISGDHAALKEVAIEDTEEEDAEEEEEGFKLYVRIRKTTIGEVGRVIEKLRQTRPINTPALVAMAKSLEGVGADDQVVYEKYVGETARSVRGRQRDDLHAARAGKTLAARWLHRLALLSEVGPCCARPCGRQEAEHEPT